ncbi:hypothetical protein V491_00233 [Pseudogymnoascus sp. VKM F-3775]|nr:hypothetical protein V491_00233 [Pseudogymnoascus sp. VKM F-3775]
MPQQNDESQIVISLQAMQNNPKLSVRAAAKIYPTDHQKISRQQVLIQYILNLTAKGFPSQLSIVEDMANRLLAIRDTLYVRSHWASNFVKRYVTLRIWTADLHRGFIALVYSSDEAGDHTQRLSAYPKRPNRQHVWYHNSRSIGGKAAVTPAFHAAFNIAMTESNIQGGFRGAGLLPFDPERVISALDLKLKTPTPQSSCLGTSQPWVSQTPNNPIEASSQSTFIKNRIAHHQNSSPTSIYAAVDQFTKGASQIMHQLALDYASSK